MFRLTTLGATDLRDRLGRPVRAVLAQPKRLALLVYLAVEGRRGPIPREQLLAVFWPGTDAERARNSLSQALHHLRRSLGPGVIESRGTHAVAVDAGALWCDAAVYAAALERGEVELALDLYRGTFCPSLASGEVPDADAWLAAQRGRFRAGALAAARTLADRLLAAGDAAGAARAARQGLVLQPDDASDVRALQAVLDAADRGGTRPGSPTAAGARRYPRLHWKGLAVLAGMALLAIVVLPRRGSPGVDRDLVAVAPFRVAASDSGLTFLGDGMVDLLARRLSGAGSVHASDPQSVFAAWRPDAGSGSAGGPGLALARRLGAGWLVTGAVLGSPQRMVFAVSLTNVTTGDARDAEVTGPLDSLAALVDEVALHLLPVISGEPAPRTASLARTPMPTLRAYLDGRSAFRAGRFDAAVEHLRDAVALDSTFALGAFELAYAAGFTSEGNGRYLPRAVALRDRLPPPDRAILTALAGPRYPARSPVVEGLDAWERATRLAPHSPEAWYDFGDYLFHGGEALGRDTGFVRAEAAFRRAVALDSGEVRALVHLTQIAARRGDVTEARRLAALAFARDSTSEQATFLRWRVAAATGDTLTAGAIEAALDTLPLGTARRLVDWSQADGIRPGSTLRALDVFRRRAASAADAELALRLQLVTNANAGRFTEWRAAFRRYAPGLSPATFDLQRYTWWMDGAAPAIAGAADPGLRVLLGIRECERQVPGACERLGSSAAALPRGRSSLDTLGALMMAAVLRAPEAESLARGVDAMRARALAFSELATHAYVEGRAYAAMGRPLQALAALRRRPYATMEANNWLAPSLRLEGRLAVQLGDTVGAVRAYRHYLSLRSDTDPDTRSTADSVRGELERLQQPR